MTIFMKNVDKVKFSTRLEKIAKKQIPFTCAKALNDTAFGIVKDEQHALEEHLDRPTPFTKRAFQVEKASKNRLVAYVKVRQLQGRYLRYQIRGGTRSPNRRAIPVPVKQRLNKYGNMPRGAIGRMLVNKKVFSGVPRGRSAEGIYQIMGGRRNRHLKMLVAYEKSASYEKRFPFYAVAGNHVQRHFRANLRRASRYAMQTAR